MGLLDVVLPSACAGCRRPGGSPCPECLDSMRAVGWVRSLPVPVVAAVAYEAVAREVVADVKFRSRRSSLGWMADAVAGVVWWARVPVDTVTWVPASRSGRRRRGFDQGQMLAREVGRRLQCPVRGLLVREGGARQAGLGRRDRLGDTGIRTRDSADPGRAQRVLVVDDVVTTGASMIAAVEALRPGASDVVGAAFAHKR
ncbi:MAG: phosphoribosyltransferase family protein [Actinomycetota bacterium]